MIFLQLIIFVGVFTAMVAFAVRNGAVNGLYFYPQPVQERAYEIGLADRKDISTKRKCFMIPFCLVMLVLLVLIVGYWNRVDNFLTAYLQSLLFLEVMNWYDGIVIDKIWVGYSKFWLLPGTEDLPYIQTWKQMLKKRGILTLVWIVGAAVAALLIIWIF